jgi:type I restriction enzyme, S subunit
MTRPTATPRDAKPALMPKLRFSEFQGGPAWDAKPGDELFDQINNRQAPAGLPILAITQEHGAIPRDEIDYHVSVTDKSVETYKEVCPGDFIISLRSFQGGIEYSRYHGICSPAYVILRKKGELSDAFFKHLFKSYGFIQQLTKNLEGLRDGKMISYKQFSELLLPWPKPAEQQKIAECLSTLDELIGAESQKLDALKAHKKGLMQQLFPREGETLPRLRFPEFEDNGNWKERELRELLEKVIDNRGKTPPLSDKGHPLIEVNALGEYSIGYGKISKYVSTETYRSWFRAHVHEGDLLFSTVGAVAEASLVGAEHKPTIAQNIVGLRFNKTVSQPFGFYLLTAPQNKSKFLRITMGAVQPSLKVSQMVHLKLLVPSTQEQHRIATCLSSLDDLIAAQSDRLAALQTHKQGLLQQLFPCPAGSEA